MAPTVVLTVACKSTLPGEAVFVVGSHYLLGQWSPLRAQKMCTTPATFPRWSTDELVFADWEVISPEPVTLQYKFIVQGEDWTGAARWEELKGNRVLEMGAGAGSVREDSVWNDYRSSTLTCPTSPATSFASCENPPAQRCDSVEERGKAITPAVAAAPPGTVQKIEALIHELAATDKLLVERNSYCRRMELEMGSIRRKAADQAGGSQEMELAAREQKISQAAKDLEAARQQGSEKDAKIEGMRRRISSLEVLACSTEASEMQAQAQKQEALIAALQRQCSEKDAKIRNLQRKSSAKDMAVAAQKKDVSRIAAAMTGSCQAHHLTWKTCHSLRAH